MKKHRLRGKKLLIEILKNLSRNEWKKVSDISKDVDVHVEPLLNNLRKMRLEGWVISKKFFDGGHNALHFKLTDEGLKALKELEEELKNKPIKIKKPIKEWSQCINPVLPRYAESSFKESLLMGVPHLLYHFAIKVKEILEDENNGKQRGN